MPFLRFAYYLLIRFLFLPPLASRAQTPVGLGWARNNVNGAIFRKNSVVMHGPEQYTAYYDSLGYVTLAKRRLPTGQWQVQRTPYKGKVQDAHNIISLMVDGAGYVHLSFDHHNNPLHYCRSKTPGSLEMSELQPMTGDQEQKVTYPEFHRFPTGDLLFLYRDGGSGNGNLVLNRYNARTQKWTRLHNVLIDGEGQRNAYWQACIDAKGTVHVSWVWRESPDVASNHDMAYACSKDGGQTWQKSTGEKYQIPITAATAEYAARIPQNSELINQTAITADAQGQPYIATYWRPAGTQVPQYQLIYLVDKQWKTVQVSQRTMPFSLSGVGTKKIPISRPQLLVATKKGRTAAYLLFRDAERQDRASVLQCPHLAAPQWTAADLTTTSVGNWEPSYDTERWKAAGVLSLFVQRTGQGDGETLENLAPQPVYILEWTPGQPVKPVSIGAVPLGFKLNGTVLEHDDRADTTTPAAGATITVTGPNDLAMTKTSGPDGKFSFKLDEKTSYVIRATQPGYFTARVTLSTTDRSQDQLPVTLTLHKIIKTSCRTAPMVLYDYNKYRIRPDAATLLDTLVQTLIDNPRIRIELLSHTDQRGSSAYNLKLSQQRAQAAKDYIVSKGIDQARITARCYGETQPLVRNPKTGADYQHNRRIEFAARIMTE